MKKYILFAVLAAATMSLVSCDEVLDRGQKNTPTDEVFWKTESDLSMYANGFYDIYFIGHASGWTSGYTFRGLTFSDDIVTTGKQSSFENQVPSSRGTTATDLGSTFMTQYAADTCSFGMIRNASIMLDRIEERMKGVISDEAYNHWHAVASFFKVMAYHRIVITFGDVPWFDKTVETSDYDVMYKDRDSREFVTDKLYDMCQNDVLKNMRTNDGDNKLNRYVAAAFISRIFLIEGTWQKYHNNNAQLSNKYLTLAKQAAEIVMNSGKYAIDQPTRVLFGSDNLAGNKECLMYRHYDAAMSVMHCITSYSNGNESSPQPANLAMLKSYICQDGLPYSNAKSIGKGLELTVENITATRDPRFEATFIDTADVSSSSLVYPCKYTDRTCIDLSVADMGRVTKYNSSTNTFDCPVIRYAEVLLNWAEATAELGTFTQADADKSINVLRDRPLDDHATAKGIKKTAHMTVADINAAFDPERDQDVDPIIWEIRRERRMELSFEYSRLVDIRRWKKLHYMDNTKYPDTMLGPWIDLSKHFIENGKSTFLYTKGEPVKERHVMKADGTIVYFDGTNEAEMVGYYMPTNVQARDAFSDRSYLAPVGESQINQYKDKGYTLTQTKGW